MEIVGYYIHGAKEYVAFSDGEKIRPDLRLRTDSTTGR